MGCLEFYGAPQDPAINKDLFELGDEIGRGKFGIVRKCVHKETREEYAVRIIDLKNFAHTQLIVRDTYAISQLQHPGIVRIFHSFVYQDHLFIVMELVKGGSLLDKIERIGFLSESSARAVVRALATALDYAHSHNIIHRNLELESLLCVPNSDEVKIPDFNFAGTVNKDTVNGSHTYVAPEVLEGHDLSGQARCACDMWSLGVVAYILLCGYPPFFEESLNDLFHAIQTGKFEFVPEDWSDKSDASKDLICRLLDVSPHRRYTAKQVLEHPWITEENLSNDHMTKAFEKFKKFNNQRRFKTVHTGIMAVNRMQFLRALSIQKKVSEPKHDSESK